MTDTPATEQTKIEAPASEVRVSAEMVALSAKLEEIRRALQLLGKDNELDHLTAMCKAMEEKQLPVGARLFILANGGLSMELVVSKGRKILDSAMDAVNLDFPLRDLKAFIKHCRNVTEDNYDYPDLLPRDHPTASFDSGSCDSAFLNQPPTSAPPTMGGSDDGSRSGNYGGSRQPRDLQSPLQQQQQRLPRRTSTSSGSGQHYQHVETNSRMGSRGSDPTASPGKPSKSKHSRVLQMFLFPERQSHSKPKRQEGHSNGSAS